MTSHFPRGIPLTRSATLRLFLAALLVLFGAAFAGCGGGDDNSGGNTTVTAPIITTQPTSQTVAVGSSATLSVTATGTSLSYQWYKGGVAISGATSSTYTISNAASSNAGSYYVIVSNSAGSVTSSTVTLTVSTSTGGANVTVG